MASQYPKNQTPGFINTIKTAAIVGAKGEIGKEFTEHLLKSGNQTVTTLTRNGSKTAVPGGVKLAHVDYNDEASLVEALKGQLKAFQELYCRLCETLEVDQLPPLERVQSLISSPAEKLIAQMTPEITSLGTVVDNIMIPDVATFVSLRDSMPLEGLWCKRIFLLESEGSIFAQVSPNAREAGIGKAFREYASNYLSQESLEKLLQLYKFHPHTEDSASVKLLTNFITDIMFFAPVVVMAGHWPGFATVGLFNEHNPWEGPYKGQANHLLDVAYTWGNYNEVYKKDNWTVARALAESVISFTCGEG
ncbi:NAD(P)-binding domain [Fusarium oxysporum f. sp. vasinfectum]|nr:NAD(P)-binding domain [Fusarium oxysporum f. sp. vasinfectum]